MLDLRPQGPGGRCAAGFFLEPMILLDQPLLPSSPSIAPLIAAGFAEEP